MYCLSLVVFCMYFRSVLSEPCPVDWKYYGDSCYALGEIQLDWPEAQDVCHSAGGKLAEIESSEENTFLMSQVHNRNDGSYWIGGTDLFHEGTWVWTSTEELISYTSWYSTEPDDYQGHQDCMLLYQPYGYMWGDDTCTTSHFFICERPPEETIVG